MSKSAHIRVSELRAIHRLIGECRERGDDPVVWRRHFLAGLGALTGGEFSVSAEIGDGTQPSRYDQGTVDCGADHGFNRAFWLQALVEFKADAFFNPLMNSYFNRATPGIVKPRCEFVADRDWYTSFYYRGIRQTLGADAGLLCILPITGTPDDHCAVYLLRHIGARDFNGRECAITAEAMAQLTPLLGGPLTRFQEPTPTALAPRARKVLRCLLEGDSDKEIALRLRIRPLTVNQYTKRIFEHFQVNSRTELLTRWIRRGWPIGHWDHEPE